jgi:site-specific recombinase XerC
LFDWLVTGQIVPVSPAGSVREPRHVVTSGQTPVLDPAETRALLDSIDVSTHAGLRDRALIGLMVYSFARIGAALPMVVEDVYTQNPRLRALWVGCARRAASGTRCRATTTSRNTLPPTSMAEACTAIPKGRCSALLAAAPAG